MIDLTEASLLDAMTRIREDVSLAVSPRRLFITPQGLAFARDLAVRDPEFARRVREEFPDLADALLGT